MNRIKGYLVIAIIQALFISCSDPTLPPHGQDWSILVYGDLRQGFGVYEQLVRNMAQVQPKPDLAVCTGDILLKAGLEAEWDNFWKFSEPVTDQVPLYIARGNHEGNSEAAEQLLHKQTGIPEGKPFYFALTQRDVRLIILDTEIRGEENAISGVQLEWLERELQQCATDAQIKRILIFMHRPLYRQGVHKGEELQNAAYLHQLFRSQVKLKAVIAGHDHLYHFMDKDGIKYIISGGAGAELKHGYGGDFFHFITLTFSETDDVIHLQTIGLFNEVIEDHTF